MAIGIHLDQLFRRHEARRVFLPRIGIDVPRDPTDAKIEEAIAYDQLQAEKRKHFRKQHDRHLRALDEMLALQIPADRQWDWLAQNRPDAMPVPIHVAATATYIVYNASNATTAAPVKQPTGSAIRTMMQLKLATGYIGRVIEWGMSFDASAAATPGQCELVETGQVGATSLTTAYAVADIMPFADPNALANTSGTSGVPFNLGTSASGFSTAAVTEGSTTASRGLDTQLLPPTGPYVKQFPLGREPSYGYYTAGAAAAQNYLRVRVTFGVTVNTTAYVITEV